MTIATIQSGMKTTFQGMASFSNADVTINDATVLDGSNQNAPFIIIWNPPALDSRQDSRTANTTYEIPVHLWDKFDAWDAMLNRLAGYVDEILTDFNDATTTVRAAGGLEATNINRIRITEELYRYAPDIQPEYTPDAMPLFAGYELMFTVEEF